jgi:hypothetical protein
VDAPRPPGLQRPVAAEQLGDVLSGHAVEVKMKAAGWFILERSE